MGFYFQDDWKLTPTLTANIGLRWEYFGRPIERYDHMASFDLGTGQQIFPGQNGVPRSLADQYYKNFASRVERNPLLDFSADLRLEKGIGLFHVHRHQDECLFRFAISFIKGTGNQGGEVLESLWSPLNRISPSLRTATLAHRTEVLDDHLNDSNWKKLVAIGVYFASLKLIISEILQWIAFVLSIAGL